MSVVTPVDRPGRPLAEQAFAELVEPHLASMLSAACAILNCEHHAWDAVQEALLTLWREPTLPPNVRAWLLRTVRHRSLQLRRCCARRRRREVTAAMCRVQCSHCEDPARTLDRQELRSILAAACERLPAELRETLMLREVESLDYHSIARRLRVPVGTVRSRLNRCRSALRSLLA
jgi:RNA polymerase sigma-70 factor (ECF subfamily)